MARRQIKNAIKLGFDNGMKDGKQQISYQSFGDINRTATEQDIAHFVLAIDNLTKKDKMIVLNLTEDEITQ